MANIKISQLTGASSALATQEFEVNDSGSSKKVTAAQIKSFVKSGLVASEITDVTATKDEINILHGATLTTVELNKLSSLTSTTSELNLLHGLTASTAELNILDGITGLASQSDATTGTSNVKLMTPLTTAQEITAKTLGVCATANVGEIGSYAYMSSTLNTLTTGSTTAGNGLQYALVYDATGSPYVSMADNTYATGTWRLMSGSFATSDLNFGLFLRIL